MTTEQQTATDADLRHAALEHRHAAHNLRNLAHNLQLRINGSRLPANIKDEYAQLARLSDRVSEQAHNLDAGVRLLVRP